MFSVSAKERAWLRLSLRWWAHQLPHRPSILPITLVGETAFVPTVYRRRGANTSATVGRNLLSYLLGTDVSLSRQFCVSAAGYLPSGPVRTPLFTPSYSTPTLHILGRTDVVVVEERSNQLLAVSANRRVEYHPGGTFVSACVGPEKRFMLVKVTLFQLKSLGETSSGLG